MHAFLLIAAFLSVTFLLAFLCHRMGRLADQTHTPGLDCVPGQPCAACYREKEARWRAQWNNAVMDIGNGKPCTHPYTTIGIHKAEPVDGTVCALCGVVV